MQSADRPARVPEALAASLGQSRPPVSVSRDRFPVASETAVTGYRNAEFVVQPIALDAEGAHTSRVTGAAFPLPRRFLGQSHPRNCSGWPSNRANARKPQTVTELIVQPIVSTRAMLPQSLRSTLPALSQIERMIQAV